MNLMKKEYKTYKKGELQEVKKKFNKESLKILSDFLDSCSKTAGKGTLVKIERQLLYFVDIIEKQLNQKPTLEELEHFLGLLKDKRDRQKLKANIKRFLKWKWKDFELLESFDFRWSRPLALKYSESDVLTDEDVEKLVRQAQSLMWKSAFILAFETGMRPSELINLKWKDIRFKEDNNTADIVIYSKKTRETRIYPVLNSVVHLKRWKQEYSYPDVKPEDYVFPGYKSVNNKIVPARERSITTHGILFALKRTAKKIGISEDRMTTYLMRHSRATELYQKMPEQVVEKLLGHKGMAKFYTHLSNEKARQELLNKIYNIKELTAEEKNEYQKKIEAIESELKQQKEEREKDKQEMIAYLKKEMLAEILKRAKEV